MCQHPVVQAVHRCLEYDHRSFPSYLPQPDEYVELLDFIDEVVASEFVPKFFVGFLHGHNNKPMLVWLWPLSGHYSQYYWVEDGTYSRPFTA